jgi:hypothetical protein
MRSSTPKTLSSPPKTLSSPPKTLSFTRKTLRTATLTAVLIAVPFAGAYAASTASSSVTALIDQAQGIDKGIREAMELKKIKPDEAHKLRMRAAHISQVAERASAGHGTIPAPQYQQLLHQLDDLSQALRFDTGGANAFGNGGDGGYYPNGYGPKG